MNSAAETDERTTLTARDDARFPANEVDVSVVIDLVKAPVIDIIIAAEVADDDVDATDVADDDVDAITEADADANMEASTGSTATRFVCFTNPIKCVFCLNGVYSEMSSAMSAIATLVGRFRKTDGRVRSRFLCR